MFCIKYSKEYHLTIKKMVKFQFYFIFDIIKFTHQKDDENERYI